MSAITFKDIKIIDSVCPGVALIFTVVRLGLRTQSGRIWWDDALALLSSLCIIVMSTATGLHYGEPYSYTLATRLGAYYLIAEGFYLTLWTARLSILFSIIRIVPEKGQKRFLYSTAIAFAAVLVFLIAQVFWVCESPRNQRWKTAPNPQCSLGLQVAACQLVTDIISDVLLIVVPVRLLARTHLERGLKIRLVIIFSATLLTTVVGLVHAAYLLEVRGVDAIISAIVEISVCLIVCNLVVVVPALYRVLGLRAEDAPRAEPSFRISSFRFQVPGLRSWVGTGTTTTTGTEASFALGTGTVRTGGAGDVGREAAAAAAGGGALEGVGVSDTTVEKVEGVPVGGKEGDKEDDGEDDVERARPKIRWEEPTRGGGG